MKKASSDVIAAPTPVERHRFHLLDALRGTTAIIVVIIHSPTFLHPALDFPGGFLAVDFFFCLSGFVVAFSYEGRLKQKLNLREFFIVRLIRLYPIYALATGIALVRGIHGSGLLRDVHSHAEYATLLALAIFLLPNLFMTAVAKLFPFDHPAWSLCCELVANAVYGAFVRLRIAYKGLLLLGTACLGTLLFVAIHARTINNGWQQDGAFVGFLRVGCSFTAGVFLYRLFQRKGKAAFRGWSAGLASLFALACLLASFYLDPLLANPGLWELLIIAVIFPGLVYLGANCPLPNQLNSICSFLGNMSYPLYLLHTPLALPFWQESNVPAIARAHWQLFDAILPLHIILLVATSWWVGRAVDEPVRKRLTTVYKSFVARSIATVQPT